ncbi:ATP-binding protein [Lysinibacillus sp. LZ02]|uniref:ATP-binding protein n=1 Tax=Lysinibacillus sp. LZ02 TaxID=3420668 RepID=UPI003D369732
MKRSIIILFSFILVTITLFIYIDSRFLSKNSINIIQDGQVDITNSILAEKTTNLDGYWRFYPNELLTPNELHDHFTTMYVPSSWTNLEEQNGISAGTYHLTVSVPKDGTYGLRFHYIRHASKVFINGKEVGGLGNPTFDPNEFEFYEKKFSVFGESEDGKLDIVIQVAHNFFMNPGIVKSVTIGTDEAIENFIQRSQLIEGAIVTTYIVISFIFIFIMLQRGRWTNEMYFALYCLAVGFYSSTQNERLLLIFVSDLSLNALWFCQFSSLYLATSFLLLFVSKTFPQYARKSFVYALFLFMLTVLVTLMLPTKLRDVLFALLPEVVTQLLLVSGPFLGFGYTLYLLVRVAQKEKAEASYLLLLFISFVCYFSTLVIEFFFEVDMGSWSLITLLIINIVLTLFVSYRHEKGYRKAQRLTQELFVQNELKDELLVKVTSEMHEPFTQIHAKSKELLEGQAGPLKVEQQQLAFSIHTTINKISHMFQTIYEAAQKDHIRFAVKPVSLRSFNELIDELTFLVENPDEVVIRNEIPSNVPPVLADDKRLRQVLLNVIHNAIQYTERGSITVRAYEKNEQIAIEVADTGIGMEEKHLVKIFDTFYQIETNHMKQGMGLGLSIVKQYMHLMVGHVEISSQLGVGTTVTLLLRKAADAPNMLFVPTPSLGDQHYMAYPLYVEGERAETIMVIDQDTEQLFNVMKLLSRHGYNVYAYNNGEDTLSVLLNNRVDLVIADVNMPEKFVLTLTKKVRELYNSVELPIILLSQNDRIGDMTQLFEEGINDIIRKSVVQKELLSHVSSLLNMREAVKCSIQQELNHYHAQITPHFLYNTLNSIIGLSYVDPAKMREALEYLAIYFRAKLDYQKQQSIVPIEEELELVEAYLAIEQLRFERLRVVMDIDETVTFNIPVMTLQPLVENAIHHGLKNKHENAELKISLQRDGNLVKIVIVDNGAGMSVEKQAQLVNGQSQRLGLLNPFEKLKLLQHTTFQLESKEDAGTTITITLKL